MKEIKFTTNYEAVLSFSDKDFKRKYEERIGNNSNYTQAIGGDVKHLAICPRCNNPVVILGIYKKDQVVKLLAKNGKWYLTEKGWISGKYLK